MFPGLVQNSTNLAIVSTERRCGGDHHQPAQRHRSQQARSRRRWSPPSSAWRDSTWNTPAAIRDGSRSPQRNRAEIAGGPRTALRQARKLIAMHAGLECGVIGEKYPGMQMVSFGPTIVDPHSPNERVQISTVQSFWKFLKAVLEKI